jgi:hypothetical protein
LGCVVAGHPPPTLPPYTYTHTHTHTYTHTGWLPCHCSRCLNACVLPLGLLGSLLFSFVGVDLTIITCIQRMCVQFLLGFWILMILLRARVRHFAGLRRCCSTVGGCSGDDAHGHDCHDAHTTRARGSLRLPQDAVWWAHVLRLCVSCCACVPPFA